MAKKKRQVRADFRKNRSTPARERIRPGGLDPDDATLEDAATHESVRGKGELTRKRTVADADVSEDGRRAGGAAGDRSCGVPIGHACCACRAW